MPRLPGRNYGQLQKLVNRLQTELSRLRARTEGLESDLDRTNRVLGFQRDLGLDSLQPAWEVLRTAGAIALMDEQITDEARTSITIRDLRVDLQDGRDLKILTGDTVIPITVDGDFDNSSTTINIDEQVITCKSGDAIWLDNAQFIAQLLLAPDKFAAIVKEIREYGAIGVTNADISGVSVTSFTIEDPPGASGGVPDGATLQLISPDGSYTELVTTNGDVTAADGTINIVSKTFSSTMPTGSVLQPAPYYLTSELLVQIGEILARVRETSAITEFRQAYEQKAITTITGTGTSTSWSCAALPDDVSDGTEVTVYTLKQNPGNLNNFLDVYNTSVNGNHSSGATTITFNDSITQYTSPGYVLTTGGEDLSRMVTNEASISVNSTSITNLVAQYDTVAIATVNGTYSGGSYSSLQITTPSRAIKKYDTYLIYNKANNDFYEVRSSEDQSTSGTWDIEDVYTGSTSVSFTAAIGDPIMPGSLSYMRQTLQGFEFRSKYLRSSGWGGTVDDEGNITANGSAAGWCLGGTGDFSFVKNSTDHIAWLGSELEIVVGGGNVTFDSDGITITEGTGTPNKIIWGTTNTFEIYGTTGGQGVIIADDYISLGTFKAGAGALQINAPNGEILLQPASSSGVGVTGGDFYVDTDTLFVDAGLDRVGINDATPTYDLDVTGDINATGIYRKGGTAGVTASIDTTVTSTIDVTGGIITGYS